jgi:hypothetical protein
MGGRKKDEKKGGPACCGTSWTVRQALVCGPWQRERQYSWIVVSTPEMASP